MTGLTVALSSYSASRLPPDWRKRWARFNEGMPLDAGPRDDLKRLRDARQALPVLPVLPVLQRGTFAAWPKPLRDAISALLREPSRQRPQ